MEKRGLFVVVEGLDGVGKTQTCRELAKRKGWLHLENEVSGFRGFMRNAPDHSGAVSRLLNLAFLQQTSDVAERLLQTENHVLTDRYIPSHRNFYTEFNRLGVSQGALLRIEPEQLSLLKPDITFCLFVEEPVREERINKRGIALGISEIELSYNRELRESIQRKLEEESDFVLNTTELSAPQVADEIEAIITRIYPHQHIRPAANKMGD